MTFLDVARELGILDAEGARRALAGRLPDEPIDRAVLRLRLLDNAQVLRVLHEEALARRRGEATTQLGTAWLLAAGLEAGRDTRALGARERGLDRVGRSWHGGRYQIERLLGEGGMGLVYLARDAQGGGPVVLKLMKRPVHQTSERFFDRFRREVHALERLDHPRIARLLAAGIAEEDRIQVPWCALEYRPGSSLDAWRRSNELDAEQAIRRLAAVAEACGHAHGLGYVHRDVKPQNLLVEDGTGEWCLLDFGLVRILCGEADFAPSSTGTVLGTPHFMAPEQYQGGDAGPPADVYGLAGVLLWALTGCRPNRLDRGRFSLGEWLAADPPPREVEALPPALLAFLRRALSVRAQDRPAEGDAFAREVLALL